MHTYLRQTIAIAALMIGAGAISTTPFFAQEHRDSTTQRDYNNTNHPDYSNNQYYRLGNQEGYDDHQRNKQRAEHKHKYGSDEDQRAHDYGYHEGWEGRRYNNAKRDHEDRDDHHDPH